MRKLILAASILAASAAGASAADLPGQPYTRVSPMFAPPYDWSGFYWGANGGGGWTPNFCDLATSAGTLIAAEGCHNAPGGVAWLHFGFRTPNDACVFVCDAQ